MSVPYLHRLRHFPATVRMLVLLGTMCERLRHFPATVRMLVLLGTMCPSLLPGAAIASSRGVGADAAVQISFQVYMWPDMVDVSGYLGDGSEDGYHYKSPEIAYQESADAEVKLIDVSSGRLSQAYRYSGSGPLMFFREKQGQDGEVLRVPLGSVSADKLTDETVLIFFPSSGNGGNSYNILPVAAPTKRIPGGQVMVYNLTRQKLAFYTGKDVQVLSPGETTLSELGRSEDASVPLRILVDDNGEWMLRHAEHQTIGEHEKLLFFIFPRDAESNRLRVLSINTAS